ncbi:MAG: SGNH/GDSL hydrolase family protein [Bacteroidota bacterium]
MKQTFTKHPYILILFLCWQLGCNLSLDPHDIPLGDLSYQSFVAIGDGFVSGFSNSIRDSEQPLATPGLYQQAQENSFPALISNQYNFVRAIGNLGPIQFNQVYYPKSGSGYLKFVDLAETNCSQPMVLAITEQIDADVNGPTVQDSNSHNLGLPLLRVSQLQRAELAQENPFFGRLAGQQSDTYLDLVEKTESDMALVWIGINDVLEYALTGGESADFRMTDPAVFQENLRNLLDLLWAKQTKVVIGSLPNICLFPYFQTIQSVIPFNQGCNGIPQLYIETTNQNEPVIRKARDRDLIMLPVGKRIGQEESNGDLFGLSPTSPIPHQWVLDEKEVDQVENRVRQFNQIIYELVAQYNGRDELARIAVAPLGEIVDQLERDRFDNGIKLSSAHLTGGVFSLDGIYLTERGNALVANEIIETINRFQQFQLTLPPVNVNDYAGIRFP